MEVLHIMAEAHQAHPNQDPQGPYLTLRELEQGLFHMCQMPVLQNQVALHLDWVEWEVF